jgi:hypothetical protein
MPDLDKEAALRRLREHEAKFDQEDPGWLARHAGQAAVSQILDNAALPQRLSDDPVEFEKKEAALRRLREHEARFDREDPGWRASRSQSKRNSISTKARGFFRLWIVASVLWIAAGAILLDVPHLIVEATTPLPAQPTYQREKAPRSTGVDAFIADTQKAIDGKLTPSQDWDMWDAAERDRSGARGEILALSIVLFGVPLLIFALGLALAWIVRGFANAT